MDTKQIELLNSMIELCHLIEDKETALKIVSILTDKRSELIKQ